MSAVTVINVVAIVVASAGAVVAFAYALTDQRRASRKPLYVWFGIVLCLIALIYVSAATTEIYLVRSGILTRMGVVFLTSLIVASVIADWRTH